MIKAAERQAIVDNAEDSIRQWVNYATPHEKADAKAWYYIAHTFAHGLSEEYGVPLHQAAAVISVLSPAVTWEQNCLDAVTVVKAYKARQFNVSVGTYGKQVHKAFQILVHNVQAEDMLDAISKPAARKTRSFYLNILDPDHSMDVTIDRWILRAMGYDTTRTTPVMYSAVAEAFVNMAARYKCMPHQLQALVWVSIRNRKGSMQYGLDM